MAVFQISSFKELKVKQDKDWIIPRCSFSFKEFDVYTDQKQRWYIFSQDIPGVEMPAKRIRFFIPKEFRCKVWMHKYWEDLLKYFDGQLILAETKDNVIIKIMNYFKFTKYDNRYYCYRGHLV